MCPPVYRIVYRIVHRPYMQRVMKAKWASGLRDVSRAATVNLSSTPKNYHTVLLLHYSRSFWWCSRLFRMRRSEVRPLRVFADVA